MPYLTKKERDNLDWNHWPETPGQLNYSLTQRIQLYLGATPNYSKFNEVIGVLECVKQELYRRRLAPYEDKKCLENGDVY